MSINAQKLVELVDELREHEAKVKEIWKKINPIVQELAIEQSPFKIGDLVKKGTVKLTRISGSLSHNYKTININYWGHKILKDGKSLHKTETQLWHWLNQDDLH